MGGQSIFDARTKVSKIIEKHPELQNHHKFNEMTPHEQQTDLWRRIKFID